MRIVYWRKECAKEKRPSQRRKVSGLSNHEIELVEESCY